MKIFSVMVIAARPLSLLLLFFFLEGCVSLEKLSGRFRQDVYYTQTVTWPGESLYLISSWYTGNGENWKVLAQSNPQLDPDRIHLGESIRIPENIVQTKKPLPHDFIQGKTEKQAPRKDEPPKLFGPKSYPAR
jgi:hypothetical protein